MFANKAGAWGLHFSLHSTFLALPANIRLGWKGFRGTNTPAFYKHWYIPTVKSFIPLGLVSLQQGPTFRYLSEISDEAKGGYLEGTILLQGESLA
jgi:hypothetical protein